jgi:hypothetical protein
MGIGAYRHLVTLEHPAVETDPPTWYCALQPAGAQVGDGLAAFFIRGRFHPGITLETQINFEGRTFQVQGIADLDERHREIQVTAVEVVGRGTTPTGAPVFVPPTITVGPVGATIDAGESVILTVIAVGAVPLFYQWTKDGVDLAGEIYQFLETGPITATTVYAVRVSNTYGSATATATIELTLSYQEQVIADGAVAYWPLDDPSGTTAGDLMGTYDGTISGGVTLNQPGVTADSTCMTFNGSSGQIDTPILPTFLPAFSYEAWIKITPAAGQYRDIAGRHWDGPAGGLDFGISDTGVLSFRVASTSAAMVSATALPVNTWLHVVATGNGTTGTLYVNGVVAGTGALALGTDAGKTGTIGNLSPYALYWSGALQDVAIYPRALTPAEILAHYHLRVPA